MTRMTDDEIAAHLADEPTADEEMSVTEVVDRATNPNYTPESKEN